MKTWQFYNLGTGIISGGFAGSDELLALSIPQGYGAIEGHRDPERFMVVNGEVVDRPQPDAEPRRVAALAVLIRKERDQRIADCSWIVERARDRNETVPQDWLDYRQALRDVPEQPGFPTDVVWPVPPA